MKLHKRSAILGGTLGAVAVAGALIAGPVFADDTTTLPNVGSTTRGMPDGGHHGLGFGGPMLHSEGVAASTDPSGTVTYITVRNQMGKVTAASDTAITVKSDDGYTRSWAISASTVVVKDGATVKASTFAVGDIVMVSGTVDGDSVTTAFVGAGGMRGGMGGMRGGHGRGHMDGDGPMGNGGMLAPVPSASASGTSA